MEKIKLVGISATSVADVEQIQKMLTMIIYVHRYGDEVRRIAAKAIGASLEEMSDDKFLKSYLPDNWSYIRNERFTGKDGVDIKPVKYYLTGEHVLKRIQFLGREIHSNFWVNSFYSKFPDSGNPWFVPDVVYPNEADGILDHGGLLYRVERGDYRGKDFLMNHPGFTKRFVVDGSMKSLHEVANEIRKQLDV